MAEGPEGRHQPQHMTQSGWQWPPEGLLSAHHTMHVLPLATASGCVLWADMMRLCRLVTGQRPSRTHPVTSPATLIADTRC